MRHCQKLLCTAVLGICTIAHAQDPLTIAILEFENTSGKTEHDCLRKGLRNFFETDLIQVKGLRVVERARLDDLMKELKLAEGKFIDPSTAAKLGKGIGAKAVLTGSYFVDQDTARLDAKLVDVQTGEILLADKADGAQKDVFAIQKLLSEKIVQKLNVTLTPKEQIALRNQYTANFPAFESYSQGLKLRDSGDADGARRALQAAVRYDNGFQLASKELAALAKQATDVIDEINRQREARARKISEAAAGVATKLDQHFKKHRAIVGMQKYDAEYFTALMLVAFHAGLSARHDDEVESLVRYTTEFLAKVPVGNTIEMHRKVLDRLVAETAFFRETAFSPDPRRVGETRLSVMDGSPVQVPVAAYMAATLNLSKPQYICMGADCKRWIGPGPQNENFSSVGGANLGHFRMRAIVLVGDMSTWLGMKKQEKADVGTYRRERTEDEQEVQENTGYLVPALPDFVLNSVWLPHTEDTLSLCLVVHDYYTTVLTQSKAPDAQAIRDSINNAANYASSLAVEGVGLKWDKTLVRRAIPFLKEKMEDAQKKPGWEKWAEKYASDLLLVVNYVGSEK